METAKPILSQAEDFARAVKSKFPNKMLAYNLSPSFNWDAAGMTDEQMESFTDKLGNAGFVWQFITLAVCTQPPRPCACFRPPCPLPATR